MMRPILLAEDSADDAMVIQSTLKKAGVLNPVFVVSDGANAVAYLKGAGFYADRDLFPLPGVFLLDLKMPGKDGFEVLEWWKTQPQLKHLLVVVLSGYHDIESIKRAYSLGARSFLTKPCTIQDIMNLRQAFTGSWNHSALQGFSHGVTDLPGSQAGVG